MFYIGIDDTQTATFETRWSFSIKSSQHNFQRDQKNREAALEDHNASATVGALLYV
jgi:hypothetical protein